MGCELGKLSKSGANPNSFDACDVQQPKVDPRLPLTAKQKYTMMASWKGISRAMETTGIYMFIK